MKLLELKNKVNGYSYGKIDSERKEIKELEEKLRRTERQVKDFTDAYNAQTGVVNNVSKINGKSPDFNNEISAEKKKTDELEVVIKKLNADLKNADEKVEK